MKELKIRIDKNGCAISDSYSGVLGDHMVTRITASFENPPKADYYRMIFKAGEKQSYTQQLFLENDCVSFDLPNSVTTMGENIVWQIYGYKMNGADCELLYISDSLVLYFGAAICDEGTPIDLSFKSELEALIDGVEDFANRFDINVDTVTTAENDQNASVGVSKNGYVFGLDFVLPKGSKGDKGDKGDKGEKGDMGNTAIGFLNLPDVIVCPIKENGKPRNLNLGYFPLRLVTGESIISNAFVTWTVSCEGVNYTATIDQFGSLTVTHNDVAVNRNLANMGGINVTAQYKNSSYRKTICFVYLFDGEKGNTGESGPAGEMPDISGKQDVINLVTSVSSSSTDAQYPSAKLFYDTVGNVEDLLEALL